MIKRAVIMRSGAMQYLESDIVPDGASNKIVTVYRSNEVLRRYHSTFKGKKLTDRHYTSDIETFNIIGEIKDTMYQDGKIVALIDTRVSLSNVEVSAGYESELTQLSDNKYELLRFYGEHVAIVDNGRCGEICKIF